MRFTPDNLPDEAITFLRERHLAILSIVLEDVLPHSSSLHSTPVGFSWDGETQTARVITFAGAKKVKAIEQRGSCPASISQVDGRRWLTLYGTVTVTGDSAVNSDAERRYGERYRPPSDRGDQRRTIEMAVDYISGQV